MHERIAHTNRISSLLVLHNLRPRIIVGGRNRASWWDVHGLQVPPELRAERERESARLALERPKRLPHFVEFTKRRVELPPAPSAQRA